MMQIERDRALMERALEEARLACRAGEVPIGAIVAAGAEILAAGHNSTVSGTDPTGHAEIIVLRRAAGRRGNHRLDGVTLYVTLEPCLMCIGAMVQARIERLVFGARDPKVGATALLGSRSVSAGLNHRFPVEGGLLEEEAGALLRSFFAARR
jgi:tRNA(adenine34) deaminase